MRPSVGQAMRLMRTNLALLVTLLAVMSLAFPIVKAAPPVVLQAFPSAGKTSVQAGASMTLLWTLAKDISEFLVYYDVTGDVLDVSIDDYPYWQSLTGRGWRFCDGCQYSVGTHDVVVSAPYEGAEFSIVFYAVPQVPVDFAGFIPANSIQAFSEFGALFPPTSTNSTIVLDATAGSYDFAIDNKLIGTTTKRTTLSLHLEGFHKLRVDATGVGADVTWTVNIQGGTSQPGLEVAIVYPKSGGCNTTLNPKSGQSTCVAGVTATPSDGGSPKITYVWSVSGGKLNSTTSQWVRWTAPSGVAVFTLTVQASATGYSSGSYSASIQVVPEFSSLALPLLLAVGLGFVVIAGRRSRHPVA